MLLLLLLLLALSVDGGRLISNVKGPHQKGTTTKSNISTKSNNYNYNIEPNVLGLLCNRLLCNDHSTHSMQLGEFILPYDLKTTIERLIIMKDNDYEQLDNWKQVQTNSSNSSSFILLLYHHHTYLIHYYSFKEQN